MILDPMERYGRKAGLGLYALLALGGIGLGGFFKPAFAASPLAAALVTAIPMLIGIVVAALSGSDFALKQNAGSQQPPQGGDTP